MFKALVECGVVSKAFKRKIINIKVWNLRDFAFDKHKTVDDRPYGGESGMILKPEPLKRAILEAKNYFKDAVVIYLSPQGVPLQQDHVQSFCEYKSIIFVCGRYEGIDERIVKKYIDLQVSIGDYVVSGGELPAMVLIDVISRSIPSVLGNNDSYNNDSFSGSTGGLKGHHYTRPQDFDGMVVPDVLLSGNHKQIQEWRDQNSIEATRLCRPDLLVKKNTSSN